MSMEDKSMSYEEATAQIESILTKLRGGEISIDDLAKEVKRATELIAYSRERLLRSEEELKRVLEA